jgi:hypothetical protein
MIAVGTSRWSVPILFALGVAGSTVEKVTDADLDLALLQLKGEVTARGATKRTSEVMWTVGKMTSCGTTNKCQQNNELAIGELVHEPMARYGLTNIEEHEMDHCKVLCEADSQCNGFMWVENSPIEWQTKTCFFKKDVDCGRFTIDTSAQKKGTRKDCWKLDRT